MRIVAAVYSHPEYYPPTLNALNLFAKRFDSITVLARNVKRQEYAFPKNVHLRLAGKYKSIEAAQNENIIWKVWSFLSFSLTFYRILLREKPDWVICYDPIPLLSFKLIGYLLIKKPKLWYHNHDVLQLKDTRSLSISRWAVKSEQRYFEKIDIFSLPAMERKVAFPMDKFKGTFFFIPNYPSLSNAVYHPKLSLKNKSVIKFIFQGSIGYNHGLEEIISLIPELNLTFGKEFKLVLKGFVSKEYRDYIFQFAVDYGVVDCLSIIGVGPYQEVFEISSSCDIGIGIHRTEDLMNRTLGTSSNKIYEYAAVGLPVLLFDNMHFKQHLANRKWAYFTDLTETSLKNCINSIMLNYEESSKSALTDFKKELNFEFVFNNTLDYIISKS